MMEMQQDMDIKKDSQIEHNLKKEHKNGKSGICEAAVAIS